MMMTNLLLCLDRTAVFEDEEDQPLVQLSSRKNRWKKSVNLPQNAESLHSYKEEKRTSSLERPVCHTGTRRVRKLACAIRRRLDFGQKLSWCSSPEKYPQVVECSQLEGPSPEAIPHDFCTSQEESNSPEHSRKGL